jgi:probable HAF family extracellular repeat protein
MFNVNAINNSRQIVGSAWTDITTNKALKGFIYQDGKAENLNDLIPKQSRYYIWEATDINDAGQITCLIVDPGTGGGAFLLTPIPSSASSVDFGSQIPSVTTKPEIIVKGTVKGVVLRVLYRVGRGPFHTAIGTNAWKFRAKLAIGRNRIAVVIERPQGRSRAKVYYIVREKP